MVDAACEKAPSKTGQQPPTAAGLQGTPGGVLEGERQGLGGARSQRAAVGGSQRSQCLRAIYLYAEALPRPHPRLALTRRSFRMLSMSARCAQDKDSGSPAP